MPQLQLTDHDSIPCRLDIVVEHAEWASETALLSVVVKNHKGERLSSTQSAWVGTMADSLPDAVKAACQGYLYGGASDDACASIKQLRQAAVADRIARLNRGEKRTAKAIERWIH